MKVKLKRTAGDCEVMRHHPIPGQRPIMSAVKRGETLEVDRDEAELLLSRGGWTRVSRKDKGRD